MESTDAIKFLLRKGILTAADATKALQRAGYVAGDEAREMVWDWQNTDESPRPLNLYYVTHTDQHGERHQIGDAIGAKTPEDALYTILEQSGTEDDGRYEVFWLTRAVA